LNFEVKKLLLSESRVFLYFSMSYLGRDSCKWRLHPHSSWSFLLEVACSQFISLHSLSFLYSLLLLFIFAFALHFFLFIYLFIVLLFIFLFNSVSIFLCLSLIFTIIIILVILFFLFLFWREPSHLLNHLVKFVFNVNIHWVSPILLIKKS